MIPRLLALLLLLPCSSAYALDDADPPFRFGLGAGLVGTLPVGSDVEQDAAPTAEFTPALWLHLEMITFDIGNHWQVGAFGRLTLAGGIDPDAVAAAVDPSVRQVTVVDENGPTGETLPLGDPSGSLTQWGLEARYFPFGGGTLRPFISLGAGLAVSRAGYTTQRGARQILEAQETGDIPDIPAASGSPFGPPSLSEVHRHDHRGLAMLVGIGLRWDIEARAFGENVRLPLALHLQYTRNQWFNLSYDEEIETQGNVLAPEGMQVDFLGLALTLSYMR